MSNIRPVWNASVTNQARNKRPITGQAVKEGRKIGQMQPSIVIRNDKPIGLRSVIAFKN